MKKQRTITIEQEKLDRLTQIKEDVGIPVSVQVEKALEKFWGDME